MLQMTDNNCCLHNDAETNNGNLAISSSHLFIECTVSICTFCNEMKTLHFILTSHLKQALSVDHDESFYAYWKPSQNLLLHGEFVLLKRLLFEGQCRPPQPLGKNSTRLVINRGYSRPWSYQQAVDVIQNPKHEQIYDDQNIKTPECTSTHTLDFYRAIGHSLHS